MLVHSERVSFAQLLGYLTSVAGFMLYTRVQMMKKHGGGARRPSSGAKLATTV